MQFRVWEDGREAMEIEADGMNEALDAAAEQLGHVDYADLAQARGWSEDDGLSIEVVETESRRTHPYASLVDAVRAVLRHYYEEPHLSDRANNIAQAVGEPDVSIADVAVMLEGSGERPPAHDPTAPCFGAAWRERCLIAGDIFAVVVRNANRRLRLEVL